MVYLIALCYVANTADNRKVQNELSQTQQQLEASNKVRNDRQTDKTMNNRNI